MKKFFGMVLIAFLLLSNLEALAYTDGTLDTTFDPGTGPSDVIRAVALQSDGKILVGGDFVTYGGVNRNRLARLNANGTLDTTFNIGTGFNGPVYAVLIDSSGKILVGGDFNSFQDIGVGGIVRLNANGTLDSTFNPGSGFDDYVFAISTQSDGKILVGGRFSVYNSSPKTSLVRLNTDGSLDSTFNTGSGVYGAIDSDLGTVYSISIQSDGKIIIAGDFLNYNNVARTRIARINTDGTLDSTFNPGTGADAGVVDTLIQPDGKLLIAGRFTVYNGILRNRIARINTDGTLDSTFNPGTGANLEIYSILLEKTNKIFIGGVFNTYNGVTHNNLARLNSDGSLDTTFKSSSEFNKVVFSSVLQSDDKLVIAGGIFSYNNVARKFIARLTDVGSSNNNNSNNGTPTPSSAPDMTEATDTGSSHTDNITSDTTPDFILSCLSGSNVTVYVDNIAVLPTENCSNSSATVSLLSPLSYGGHNITFTQKVNGIESAKSPILYIVESQDDTGPVINGITNIGTTAVATPSYVFTSNESGVIQYGGGCSSNTNIAYTGFNNIIFNTLSPGYYPNCTIKVVDLAGNSSNVLNISPFTITGTNVNNTNNNNLSTAGCTSTTMYSPFTGAKCPNYVPQNQSSFVDTNPVICPHFTQYIKYGSKANDTNEVKRWQDFLSSSEGAGLSVDGKFGRLTLAAIKNFQTKYATSILLPWGIAEPTGYVYKSTRAKANKLFNCPEGEVVLDNGATIR